jgi:hypothetical protein
LRISRDADGLQLDFMSQIDGIRSFDGLRSRALKLKLGGFTVTAASLADIIRSKRAAGRTQDLAVLPALEQTLAEATHNAETEFGGSKDGE